MRLDVIEQAIRSALEKGDADDRAFREKVYRSAFAALERALQGNPDLAPEIAGKRRSDLQAKIAEIETEFIPARPSPSRPPPPVVGPAEEMAAAAPAIELDTDTPSPSAPWPEDPVVEAPGIATPEWVGPVIETDGPTPEPFFADVSDFGEIGAPLAKPAVEELTAAGGPNVVAERRRRPIAAVFLGVTVLAVAAIGIWWAISTGLIQLPQQAEDDGITQPAAEDETYVPGADEAPAKPGEPDLTRNWTPVFSPSDATTVNAPGDTKADAMKDDSGEFLRIRSGASGSAIIFDVPQGVLEAIAGKHAVFDIVARAEEGKSTQISIDCNFGELGDCGRKRYEVGYEKGDFLFEMEMPKKAPGSEGTIAITSDIDNAGKAIDVYEIKVSVPQ